MAPNNTVTKISAESIRTNLYLKTDKSINVLLKSSIGPKTRNVTIEPAENVPAKEEATKASDVEQIDKMYAKIIIKICELISPCPISTRLPLGKKV